MPEICKHNPSLKDLAAINQCRLYLEAYFVSDIASASGQRLSSHAWEGSQRTLGHTSRFNWPAQGMPSKNAWNTWWKFLKASILHRGMQLRMDLGPWLRQDFDIWHWYYSPSLDSVIQIAAARETYLLPQKTHF
jgi:hypothetical protein